MLSLLITVLLAGLFALFATQNTQVADLNFGGYVIKGLPMYLIILVPLVLGLLASYFIYVAYSLSTRLTINEQKDKIRRLSQEKAEITKKFHKLELELTSLKAKNGEAVDEDSI